MFSATEKMAHWLSRRNGDYWYVRLLGPAAMGEVLRDLLAKGFREIYANLEEVGEGKIMAIAEMVMEYHRQLKSEKKSSLRAIAPAKECSG